MSTLRCGSGKRVAFIHPDLGIGGAERLVVDAVMELSSLGYEVVMYTGYHNVQRCFEETLDQAGKRAAWVRVHGSWIPRHIHGRLHALFANLRCLWATVALLMKEKNLSFVFVDQVSAPVIILRAFASMRILFYCHFPDMLLAKHDSIFRRMYRAPIDYFEQFTTGLAHKVLVNSSFTSEVFARTFQSLYKTGCQPGILYPSVSTTKALPPLGNVNDSLGAKRVSEVQQTKLFLSINRFERKKNLSLALKAYACYRFNTVQVCGCTTQLILAGGYDNRLRENVQYFEELQRCLCVIYTPTDEHFGIVPLEAMAAAKPVVACCSGGPVESVVDGVTGILCASVPEEFALAMERISENPEKAARMGRLAQLHVERKFSRGAFGLHLHEQFMELNRGQQGAGVGHRRRLHGMFFIFGCLLLVLIVLCYH